MKKTLKDIGSTIAKYLRRILDEGRNPDIDIPASKTIKQDLLALLPVNDSLPKEEDCQKLPFDYDPVWKDKLEVLARVVCDSFRDEPDDWSSLVEILSIYFRDIHVTEGTHPYVVVRKSQDGTYQPNQIGNKHQILIKLAPLVLENWIAEASPSVRKKFFNEPKGWEILTQTAEALPFWTLTPNEFVAVFAAFHEISQNDLARGSLFGNVERWAFKNQNLPIIKQLTEEWVDNPKQQPRLDEFAIQFFVEILLESGAEDTKWRDKIIKTLLKRNEIKAWRLTVTLSCFAWPKNTNVKKRHKSLQKYVKKLPNQLLLEALSAMARDAWQYPDEALDTTYTLLQMADLEKQYHEKIPERGLPLVSLHIATIARNAMQGMDKKGYNCKKIAPLEDYLLWVPQEYVKANFDSFLRKLYQHDPKLTLRFLTSWLSKHSASLRVVHRSIDEHFPLLWDIMGAKEAIKWLAGLLVAKNENLRSSAISLLNVRAERQESLPSSVWEDWSESKTKTFIHILMSRAVVGNFLLPTLFSIGKQRDDVRDLIVKIIEHELLLEYPEQCKHYLDTLWSQDSTEETPNTALQKSHRHLIDVHERLVSLQQKRKDFLELHAVHPFHDAMFEQYNNMLKEAYDDFSQRPDRLFNMIPKVPIARGEGTFIEKGQVGEEKFAEFSSHMDIPLFESCDPVGREMLRHEHKELADILLSAEEEEP